MKFKKYLCLLLTLLTAAMSLSLSSCVSKDREAGNIAGCEQDIQNTEKRLSGSGADKFFDNDDLTVSENIGDNRNLKEAAVLSNNEGSDAAVTVIQSAPETIDAQDHSESSPSFAEEPVSDSEKTSIYPEGTDPDTLGSMTQLVNRAHGLPVDYVPVDLVENELPGIRVTFLRSEAAQALSELFAAAENDGIRLLCCSGFRSYTDQKEVYADNINSLGEAIAYMTTAQPGFSEHQTGLAMDVTSALAVYSLSTDFIKTAEGQWIDKCAWQYGFIVRYPNGAENITGYTYEPWHIRYLGKDIAKAVHESGKTYEEYLGVVLKR